MNSMISTLDWSAAAWLGMAVKGGLVLAAAGVAAIALHHASAAWRHLVWTVALVSLPVLTLLSLVGPGWRLPVLEPAEAASPPRAVISTAAPVLDAADGPGFEKSTSVTAGQGTAAVAAPSGNEQAHASRNVITLPLGTWLLGAWAVASIIFCLPLGLGLLSLLRVRRAARRPDDGYWDQALDQARRDLQLKRPVKLLEHDRQTMPMTWGVSRPAVMLPVEARTWAVEKQRAVLLHELAHVRRHDYLTRMIARIGFALHAFNPLAWVAWRRMHTESERACDDRVLAAGADPADYADQLIQIAQRCTAAQWSAASAITMARKSQLEGRILAVLDAARSRAAISRVRILGYLLLAVAVVIPVSVVRLVAADARESPFARSVTESELVDRRDQANHDGDLLLALQGEMDRVMLRAETGHAYKDKIDLVGVWEDYREYNEPGADETQRLMTEVGAWGESFDENVEYPWRVAHVLSAMAGDAGRSDTARAWMERTLEFYPDVRYPEPSKHSKFQHLVNEMAGLRWDHEDGHKAFMEALSRFQEDPRFEYFFLPWWEDELKEREGDENVGKLNELILQGYLGRLERFPDRADVTRKYMAKLADETDARWISDAVLALLDTEAAAPAGPVQALIDQAQPGDTVEIPKGTHGEPLRIDKALTLRGIERSQAMLKVESDKPAIHVLTDEPVSIENLTIEWQRRTSRRSEHPQAAVVAGDGRLSIVNCEFSGEAGIERCPAALLVDGFADLELRDCLFSGFNFTAQVTGGAKGVVEDCAFVNSGHCGLTALKGAELTVRRNLFTGSAYHGLRCTGGTLHAEDNLIIANRNRGIYVGNRAAHGSIRNNLILGNASGISVFGGSDTEIRNNVILDNTFVGIDARSFCPIKVEGNILAGNDQGFIVWKEGNAPAVVNLSANTFWENTSNDVANMDLPVDTVLADPGFADATAGDYSRPGASGPGADHGLTDPAALKPVWEKWEAVRKLVGRR